MKRILFMHHASLVGGGSYCLLNLLKQIDLNIFESYLLLKSNGPLAEEAKKIGITVLFFEQMEPVPYNESLKKIRTIRSYALIYKSLKYFKKILLDNKIDIVYVNNMMLYPYLKPAKETGASTLIHIREHWPLNEHKFQLKLSQKIVSKYCNKVIAINSYSASMFPSSNVSIIYDWIDMEARKNELHLSDYFGEEICDKKVYIYLGGMQQIKGVLHVVKAFSQEILGDDKRLLLLGINPVYPSLRGFKSKVSFFLHRKGLRKIYVLETIDIINSDPRIKCVPSTYAITNILSEAYCNISYFTIPHANLAMAEAIIVGTPSIASKTDEAVEYSRDGRLSKLFAINDYSQFIESIKRYDAEYYLLKENIQKEGSYVKIMFNKERNIGNWVQLINSFK